MKQDASVVTPGADAIASSGVRDVNLRIKAAADHGKARHDQVSEECKNQQELIKTECNKDNTSLKEASGNETDLSAQQKLKDQMAANNRYMNKAVDIAKKQSRCMEENAKAYEKVSNQGELQADTLETPEKEQEMNEIDKATLTKAAEATVDQGASRAGQLASKLGAEGASTALGGLGKAAPLITPVVGAYNGNGYDVITGLGVAATCIAVGGAPCVVADIGAQSMAPSPTAADDYYYSSPYAAYQNGAPFHVWPVPQSITPESVSTPTGAIQNEQAIGILRAGSN